MNIEKARSYFPHLKEDIIYFNHAATSPLNTLVTDKINEYVTERSYKLIDNFQKASGFANSTKEDIGRMINCSADRIAYLDNTSNGINILASGITWNKGDRILLNDLEFPANVYPYLNLKQEGVEVDFVKSHGGIVSAEDIISNIKPETKLVSVSFVQFLSGYKIDLEKMGNFCRSNNILFCVDAIQGLGAVKLDVQKCKIDFLSSGTQKWLLGIQGSAFIYLTEELQNSLNMKYVGWLSVEDAWNILNYDLTLQKSANRYQNGTISHIGVYALRGAMDYFLQFSWDEIENQVLKNAIHLSSKLLSAGFKPILSDCKKENLSGIVTFSHPESQKVYEHFAKNRITCSVREGMIRLSPHFYNTEEENGRVVEVLGKF